MKKNNMASLLALFCTALIAVTMIAVGEASNEFKVGESRGWREPANDTDPYNQWAVKNRFRVGDSLYFEYKEDSVLVVDKFGYYHCNTSNPISAFNDGKTVINLDRPGPFYFISGAPNHCKNGQRLVIEVLTPHPTPQSPPSIAIPPQPFMADSPAPSPHTSSGVTIAVTLIPIIAVTLIPIVMVVATTLVTLVWGAP